MTHPHKAMVDKALELTAAIKNKRERARVIGIPEGTLRRWLEGSYGVPLRKTLVPLRAFLKRHGALGEGMDPGDVPGPSQEARAGRLELIRLLADPDVSDEDAAAAMIREASRILGKRP